MKAEMASDKRATKQGILNIQSRIQNIAPKVNAVATKLDAALGKHISPLHHTLLLLGLKYLYIFLTVLILKDQWYVGYGSYGIDFVFWKEVLGTIVFVPICLLYMNTKITDSFVDDVLYFLLVIYYIPLNSAFSINNQPLLFFLSSNLYFALLTALTGWTMKLLHKYQKQEKPKSVCEPLFDLYNDRNVVSLCVIICCAFIVYKLFYNGLSLSVSMDGNDVYGRRAEFMEYLDSIDGTPFAYLLSILRNVVTVVAPFYVLISLMRKKWAQVVLGLACVLAQYSVSAGKSTLLFIAIIAVLYLCYRLNLLKHFKQIFLFGMFLLMAVCLLEHFIFQSDRIFTLLIRRMLYYPAWLNTMYFEYFVENGPVLWSQNVFLLQNILEPVYDTSPLTIISQVYFAGQVPSPNTGLFAEAVMHFGILGTVIYPVLLTVLLLLSSMIFKPYGLCVQVFFAIKLALHLQNVPITRTDSVLSYFLFAFLLLVLPRLHWCRMPPKLRMVLSGRKKQS